MKVRKIESKAEEARKKKRNQWILGLIMVFILTGGVFGIVVSTFGNSESGNMFRDSVVIDNREFVENQGYWLTNNPKKQENLLGFVYLPNQTIENNSAEISEINLDYSDVPLYIDTNFTETIYPIYRNFQDITLRIQRACINQDDCEGDYPIKTCEENIIIIKKSEEISINQEDSCVYITAPEDELVKLTEEFIYRYYNIK